MCFFKVFWRQLLGSGDFKSVKLSQTTVCNLIVERLLPTREKNLLVTKYLNFYWLRVHFVLSPTIRILEAKIAIPPSSDTRVPVLQYSYLTTIGSRSAPDIVLTDRYPVEIRLLCGSNVRILASWILNWFAVPGTTVGFWLHACDFHKLRTHGREGKGEANWGSGTLTHVSAQCTQFYYQGINNSGTSWCSQEANWTRRKEKVSYEGSVGMLWQRGNLSNPATELSVRISVRRCTYSDVINPRPESQLPTHECRPQILLPN